MVKAARESATRRLPHLETRALDSKEAANPRTRPGLSEAIFLLIECSVTHLHGAVLQRPQHFQATRGRLLASQTFA
jgi:hypothetical protein